MIVVPFLPEHLKGFNVQADQKEIIGYAEQFNYPEFLFNAGPAYSGFVGEKCVVCAGVSPDAPWMATAWAVVAQVAPMFSVTKAIIRFLDGTKFKRIQTPVRQDFTNAHQWARMLGFEKEGSMRAYDQDGNTHDLYARIRWE